jgi:hypothetical protein
MSLEALEQSSFMGLTKAPNSALSCSFGPLAAVLNR